MSQWTSESVLSLAPDSSSASAARGLVGAASWVSAGQQGATVWGEARGSGAKPYQTAIDLREPAFKCSCPSRKFPCKHALGLFLRFVNGEIGPGQPPGWVEEWLDKRDERSVKQATKAEAPAEVDPAAAEKRAAKRWSNILAGLDECEAFLVDSVGQGLLAAQSARSWDQMAARMVDAQAPGVATRLKRIGSELGVGDDWGPALTSQLGNLALLLEASRRIERLPELLGADVRSALGISVRKEDLVDPITDVWDVLGQITETEDRVTVCRSWLRSRTDGRWATHLTFSVAGQAFDYRPLPGSALAAQAFFYPSAWPLRVHLGDREIVAFGPSEGGDWPSALDYAAQSWASCPWIDNIPVLLDTAQIGRSERTWFALDQLGQGMPLRGPEPWPVLTMTGNNPSSLFGEWDGNTLRLLAAWGDWGYVAL